MPISNPPQVVTPSPHAPTHQEGGSDPVDADKVDGHEGFLLRGQICFNTGHEVNQNPNRGNLGIWGFDGTYYYCETPAAANYQASVRTPVKTAQDATMEWINKFATEDAYTDQHSGLIAPFSGSETDFIRFLQATIDEKVGNLTGGSITFTILPARDWSVERVFKFEWTPTAITFYEDGAQVAQHTTNIPTADLYIHMDCRTDAVSAPATAPRVDIRDIKIRG